MSFDNIHSFSPPQPHAEDSPKLFKEGTSKEVTKANTCAVTKLPSARTRTPSTISASTSTGDFSIEIPNEPEVHIPTTSYKQRSSKAPLSESDKIAIKKEFLKSRAIHAAKIMQKSPKAAHLPSLGGSQNPVARIRSNFFMPSLSLAGRTVEFSSNQSALYNFKKNLNEEYQKTNRENPEAALVIKPVVIEILNRLKDSRITPQAILKEIEKQLSDIGDDDEFSDDESVDDEDISLKRTFLDRIKDFFTQLFAPADVSRMIQYVVKDDLLKNLKIIDLMASEQRSKPELPEPEKKYESPLDVIRSALKDSSEEFVPHELLKTIQTFFDKYPELSEDYPNIDFSRILSLNLEHYVSSADFLAENNYSERSLAILSQIPNEEKQGITLGLGIKTGIENANEIKANRCNVITGANPYLSPKIETNLSNAYLNGQSKVISSAWLDEGKELVRADFQNYFEIKQKLAVATFRGEPREEFSQELAAAKEKITSVVSSRSSAAHALQDLEQQSYDSHMGQYLLVNEDAICFDFARFFAPSVCYTQEGKNSETFVAFRSFFLDSPVAEDPLPAEIIQDIENRNIEEISKQMHQEKLVGKRSDFDKAKADIGQIHLDYDSLNGASSKHLQTLCEKYSVYFNHSDKSLSQTTLIQKMKADRANIQEKCMKQVHPEAFEAWISRMEAMKEYIRGDENPKTLKGLRDFLYPELAVFFKVLERIDINPSSTIGISKKNGPATKTSLESIITRAKDENLANEAELREMNENLALLKQKACTNRDLSLTMDL